MNYFPATGGSGGNLKYYVDGVQKKLKGYKVLNIPWVYGASMFYCNGKIYTVGDTNLHVLVGNHFRRLADLPYNKSKGKIVENNGQLYYFYYNEHFTSAWIKRVYLYDEYTNGWTNVTNMPITNQSSGPGTLSAVSVNNELYVVYTEDNASASAKYTIYKYMERMKAWQQVTAVTLYNSNGISLINIDDNLCFRCVNTHSQDVYRVKSDSTFEKIGVTYNDLNDFATILFDPIEHKTYGVKTTGGFTVERITINGVEEMPQMLTNNNFSGAGFMMLDGILHCADTSTGNYSYYDNASHIIFDKDGVPHWQKHSNEPEMIPIFE